jgi:biotin carboxylase
MSSPPYLAHNALGIAQTIEYVKHVEKISGVHNSSQVVNGSRVTEIISTRSRQLALFASLGIPFPKTRIVSSIDQLLAASNELRFPLIIKSNSITDPAVTRRFDSTSDLVNALVKDELHLRNDKSWLVQEYIQPKGNYVNRVEILNGCVLYAVKIYHADDEPERWPIEVKASVFTPSLEVLSTIEKIAHAALIDTGSIEYVTDRKTNQVYFYAIRPHTSSRSIHIEGIDFNPVDRLSQYIEQRLQKIKEIALTI